MGPSWNMAILQREEEREREGDMYIGVGSSVMGPTHLMIDAHEQVVNLKH